jgi:type IV pilus assembly protein PilA
MMRANRSQGFTLIELLIVIIIVAILAAIAIPTFFGARSQAHNAASYTLVRNALTAVESLNIDYRDYRNVTLHDLQGIEPSISWNVVAFDLVDPLVPTISQNVVAGARFNQIDFYPQARDAFDVATRSESGDLYGIEVVTTGNSQTSYIKVKIVDGQGSRGL